MKKVFIFSGIMFLLFVLLVVTTNMQNKQSSEGNPYDKETLHPETIKQLDDPIYQNQLSAEQFKDKMANNETITVYFYSPTCSHCKVTSPVVVPLAEEMDVDLKKYNLLEFKEGWDEYNISGTPTIVHYKDGKEVGRIEGSASEEQFTSWFNSVVKENQ